MKAKFKEFYKNLVEIVKKPELFTLPSTLAYYFVLSIVPIITILLWIAGSFNLSTTYITGFIERNFSPELMELITPIFTEQSFSFGFLVYLLFAFFLSSNGSDAIIVASNTVFNIKNKNVVKRRLKAFMMTIILFGLITFMLTVSVFGSQLLQLINNMGFDNSVIKIINMLHPVLNIPITLIVLYYGIKLIFIVAPNEKIKSKYVSKGAIFTTICWFIATFVYSYYIKNIANYNTFYSGLSIIVVLMIWFYILAFIFVVGLCLNYSNVEEQIEKTNTIKLKELEEKVKASKNI